MSHICRMRHREQRQRYPPNQFRIDIGMISYQVLPDYGCLPDFTYPCASCIALTDWGSPQNEGRKHAMSATSRPRHNPLLSKLEQFAALDAPDLEALERLMRTEERFPSDWDIVSEGQEPRSVFVLLEGLACRYRLLPNGTRQIMTFLLPGDLCDLHVFLLRKMDHAIGSLTPVRLAPIKREDVLELSMRHPRISASLWWSTLQEEAMLRERIVSLGRRNALERVAYLLCELVWRQQAIGHASGDTIDLPLTQLELADALGLTPVHVNRVLQGLRREGLLVLEHRRLTILNLDALAAVAAFNASYLHLNKAPSDIWRYIDREEQSQKQGQA